MVRHNNGTKWVRIQGPPVAYNITDFKLAMKRLMKYNGDDEDSINIQLKLQYLKITNYFCSYIPKRFHNRK